MRNSGLRSIEMVLVLMAAILSLATESLLAAAMIRPATACSRPVQEAAISANQATRWQRRISPAGWR